MGHAKLNASKKDKEALAARIAGNEKLKTAAGAYQLIVESSTLEQGDTLVIEAGYADIQSFTATNGDTIEYLGFEAKVTDKKGNDKKPIAISVGTLISRTFSLDKLSDYTSASLSYRFGKKIPLEVEKTDKGVLLKLPEALEIELTEVAPVAYVKDANSYKATKRTYSKMTQKNNFAYATA